MSLRYEHWVLALVTTGALAYLVGKDAGKREAEVQGFVNDWNESMADLKRSAASVEAAEDTFDEEEWREDIEERRADWDRKMSSIRRRMED